MDRLRRMIGDALRAADCGLPLAEIRRRLQAALDVIATMRDELPDEPLPFGDPPVELPADDGAKSRRADARTAHEAAGANAHRRVGQRQRLLLALLDSYERHFAGRVAGEFGVTSEQLAEKTGIPLNSVSTRVSELKRRGTVYVVADDRRTSNGARAEAVALTPVVGLAVAEMCRREGAKR